MAPWGQPDQAPRARPDQAPRTRPDQAPPTRPDQALPPPSAAAGRARSAAAAVPRCCRRSLASPAPPLPAVRIDISIYTTRLLTNSSILLAQCHYCSRKARGRTRTRTLIMCTRMQSSSHLQRGQLLRARARPLQLRPDFSHLRAAPRGACPCQNTHRHEGSEHRKAGVGHACKIDAWSTQLAAAAPRGIQEEARTEAAPSPGLQLSAELPAREFALAARACASMS